MTFVNRYIDLNAKYKAGKACPVCFHVQGVNTIDGVSEKLVCPDCLASIEGENITCCKCKQTTRAV